MRSLLAILVVGLAAIAPAHADATVAAQGTVTYQTISAGMTETCSAPLGITFEQSGDPFVLREVIGPGEGPTTCALDTLVGDADGPYTNQGQTTQECVPAANAGPHFLASTIGRSGSTYTIQTPHRYCDGTQVTDTIVFTLGATKVSYRHDVRVGGALTMHVQGTLSRAV